MLLLDTNAIAEVMRGPDSDIAAWLYSTDMSDCVLPAIAVEETRFGLPAMPTGKRQRKLQEQFETLLGILRTVPFDIAAAYACAALRARLAATGNPIELPDAQIAGIAIALEARVVTRNLRHFSRTGVEIINPWGTS